MKILGVNTSHHPSICIYEDNKISKFYNEERFTLRKNVSPESYKFKLYQSILHHIDFKPDVVCYASFHRSLNEVTDKEIIDVLQKQLGNPLYFFDEKKHHLYHALCGKYFSNFKDAICIVIDSGGASTYKPPFREVQSVYYVDDAGIVPMYKHSTLADTVIELVNAHQFDAFHQKNLTFEYKTFLEGYEQSFSSKIKGGLHFNLGSEICGFKYGHDAGKLMGLSSYAYCNKKYDLDYEKVKIAKNVQEIAFDETCELIDRFRFKSNNIILSGGCALNCSNNFKYVKKYPDLNFFVDPIPGDSGTAIGACIYYDKYKR
jgi:predicted NodU family carbamoyl transferase|tara:strand:- start:605 stop:1555 length:951 start_codon:yes stop_codon:yes gene_type:complete